MVKEIELSFEWFFRVGTKECSLNDLFHDVVTVILMSRTAISELDNDDDDDDWPLVVD